MRNWSEGGEWQLKWRKDKQQIKIMNTLSQKRMLTLVKSEHAHFFLIKMKSEEAQSVSVAAV